MEMICGLKVCIFFIFYFLFNLLFLGSRSMHLCSKGNQHLLGGRSLCGPNGISTNIQKKLHYA